MTSVITKLEQHNPTQQRVPAGSRLFSPGDSCEHYVVVANGQVRVELLTTTGHQLLLYRINAGEACVMSTACLMGTSAYSAQAIAETEVELLLLSKSEFQKAIAGSEPFRESVLGNFSDKLAALMQRISSLATSSIDQRLAAALIAYVDKSADTKEIEVTHEQLGIEVGTSREVISRRLAALDARGFISKKRGAISVEDSDALRKMLAD